MTTAPVPRTPHRVSWDVLRAVAVALVVLEHSTYGAPYIVHELGIRPWEQSLPIGASALMVISGYFVCHTIDAAGPKALLRARLVRMMPAFAVATLFVWTALNLFGPDTWRTGPDDLIATILVFPTTLSPEWILVDPAYWTMVAQLLVFCVAAGLTALWRPRGTALHAVLWAVAIGPALIALVVLPNAPDWLTSVFYQARLERIHVFAAGAAIWMWANKRLGPEVLAVLVGVVAAQAHFTPSDVRMPVALGVFCVFMAAAAAGPDWYHPSLRHVLRPVIWLSGISYGVYLMNLGAGMALMWQLHLLGVPPGWQSVAAVVSAVVLGWLLTRVVERPFSRWWRARSKAAPPASATASVWGTPGSTTPGSTTATR